MSQIDDTHVMKEREASRRWGRGSYGGLAQHSGSAGNSNHNHFSAPHAYFYMPVGPRRHHSRSASGSSPKTVPLCAGRWVLEMLALFFNWNQSGQTPSKGSSQTERGGDAALLLILKVYQ